MIKKFKENKLLLSLAILIIGVLLVLIIRITYAFLENELMTDKGANVQIDVDDLYSLQYVPGDNLNLTVNAKTLTENGKDLEIVSKPRVELIDRHPEKAYHYYVYLLISGSDFAYTNGLEPEILLTINGPDGELKEVSDLSYNTDLGGFDITQTKGVIAIATNKEMHSNGTTLTTQEWAFTLKYRNLAEDQSENLNKILNIKIIMQDEELTTKDILLAYANTPNQVTLYHHNAKDLTDPNMANKELIADDDSYRYSGGNDIVNNYICFGGDCSNDPANPNYKNLYRIIGLFKNEDNESEDYGNYEMKIIKADYANSDLLGKGANTPGETVNYEMDGSYYTEATYGPKLNVQNFPEEQDAFAHRYRGSLNAVDRYRYQENGMVETNADWPKALLNTIHLNHNFLNSFDVNWQNKITKHDWKYKGNTWLEIAVGSKDNAKTIKNTYDHELGKDSNPITYNAKIGLMYVSDYLYAASSNNWTKWPINNVYTYNVNGYDTENIPIGTYGGTDGTDYRSAIDENWLYMGLWEWTITQLTDSPGNLSFTLDAPGNVDSVYVGMGRYVVRPCFYLSSDAKIINGSGTDSDPFILEVRSN